MKPEFMSPIPQLLHSVLSNVSTAEKRIFTEFQCVALIDADLYRARSGLDLSFKRNQKLWLLKKCAMSIIIGGRRCIGSRSRSNYFRDTTSPVILYLSNTYFCKNALNFIPLERQSKSFFVNSSIIVGNVI